MPDPTQHPPSSALPQDPGTLPEPLLWHGQRFQAHPCGGLLWLSAPSPCLIISDLHFGKVGHFRKSGMALPPAAAAAVFDRFADACQQVERVLILGDLAHSDWNAELERFAAWRQTQPALAVQLVPGNHDILEDAAYSKLGIERLAPLHEEAGICFVHDPQDPRLEPDAVRMAGHWHPAVQLKGKGRQRLTLPCFWFGARMALLPASGAFTGGHRIKPGPKDTVYAWTGESVWAV